MVHPARLPVEEFRTQVQLETTRGPGPGGQHKNKADTAVRATHKPTGIRTHAGERRSMHANQREALKRLRRRVAAKHREPLDPEGFGPDGVYEPSELWQGRLQGRRLVVSAEHEDLPALLSEALDVLAHCEDDVSRASGMLGTSTSQFVRFLAKIPSVLGELNERRRARGLRSLQ